MRRFARVVIVFVGISVGVGGSSAVAQDAKLRCQHLPLLFEAFLRVHYSMKVLNADVKARTVEQFVKSLDPSKSLLLDADAQKLRKDVAVVFETFKTGDCSPLEKAFDLVISRADEDEQTVRELMKGRFQLDETVELNTASDKRGWSRTAEERRELLRKLLHFQLSSYLLTDLKLEDAKKQLAHRYELHAKRLKERRTNGEVPGYFAEAFATSLDPHSDYLSPETFEDFQIQMRLSLEGIGASLTNDDGFTVIEDLIPGGSASRLGVLRPKDKIIAVAQDGKQAVNVIDMDLKDVVRQIRGKKGTKVTLTILRQGERTETFDVTIVRDKVDIQDQAAKITYEERRHEGKVYQVGVLDLPSFYGDRGTRTSYADVRKLLEEARERNVDGLVLNLSRNGGGLLEDAVRISGLFIRKGAIVATRNFEKRRDVLSDDDDGILFNGPLVVLTSHLSASASEILAGALKDYGRAVVVGGEHTFGKGTVQTLSHLPAGLGAIKVTNGMFFLPGGESTQHAGVVPHIQVPSIYNNTEVGEKTMDYSLPPQSTEAFLSKDANATEKERRWGTVTPSLIRKLSALSSHRVASDPKFVDVRKELEEATKNRGVVKLSDLRKKSAEEKAKEKEKDKSGKAGGPDEVRGVRAKREEKLKDLEAPFLMEGVNIVVDLIALTKS